MKLTILNVAYPLAPVGVDAVGGAEQILTHLDQALTRAGHHSIVIACRGSEAAGTLIETPCPGGEMRSHLQAEAHRATHAAIEEALARWPIDVVHLHGIDFFGYLPPGDVPTLVTLHLPPSWYPADIFSLQRPRTVLQCVSRNQRAVCPPTAVDLPVVENGAPVDLLRGSYRKRNYVISMGRICWEKGFHLAMDAAAAAGSKMFLAGEVFPYPAHRDYFDKQIVPRLSSDCRYLGPLGFSAKRRLLSSARALLVTSQVPETSSLVAMEALACGTPVIAFPIGALPEIIEDGRTGYLVTSVNEMSAAIRAIGAIDPRVCRETAEARFSLDRMFEKYLALYTELVGAPVAPVAA
jgi:glycosyltransferase involved in cell wall biosynthesis